jgi:hypothetical protein
MTPRGGKVSSTYPEDGGNMLFRSTGAYLQNYTVSDSSRVIITNCQGKRTVCNHIKFLSKYYPGDEIKKDERGGKCGTYGSDEGSSRNRKREWNGMIWLRIAQSGGLI